MTNPIIVVGPGRCGTSCVAGVLHHLGVFMGARLLGPHPTNPYGHFEDREFLELNIARLQKSLPREKWASEVKDLIKKRAALGVSWGWKDPRTCNLLRDYLQLLEAPKFVRCRRDPARIEESVVKAYGRNGWTAGDAQTLRIRRERELDRYLPWYETMEVNFDSMLSSREQTVHSLAKFCGLTDVKAERTRAAIDFIRPPENAQAKIKPVPVEATAAVARHYRAWVGRTEMYDMIGALQFNVLTMLGMREGHTLLDVGCGSLRGGRLAISYLLPGYYFGIEPESWLIEDGIKHHLGQEMATLKQPHFSDDPNFTCSVFGRKFDFILAHSIFSHAAQHQILRCLRQASLTMHDRSLLIATYNVGKSNYTGNDWVYPGCVSYTEERFNQVAAQSGMVTQALNWFHPTGQRWVALATKDGVKHLGSALLTFEKRRGALSLPVGGLA